LWLRHPTVSRSGHPKAQVVFSPPHLFLSPRPLKMDAYSASIPIGVSHSQVPNHPHIV
jgi:hypothetical protein